MFAASGINGKSETISKDTYGRELFKYSIYPDGFAPPYKEICVYAIIQRNTHDEIYYYEDYCFIIADSFNIITEKDIEELKQNNNWDMAFVPEKCSTRNKIRHSNEFEYVESINSIEKIISEYFDEGYELKYYMGTDIDKDGNILIVFQAKKDDEETRNYMIILTSRGLPRGKECFAEIEDLYNYQEQLHELKIANDWNFS